MISLNHNLMASDTANALTSHYGRLQTSTQRLSSGLRINSAADDAAGLAIRELMRADIAALSQGTRNANDAISMLQTFDGALSVIDEKLIRMKELAEQAATGTYDSTQRLMIDSEFQAMGSEIDRIARATDFNGIKLLDGKNPAQTQAADGIAVLTEVKVGDKTYDVSGSSTFVSAWPGASASLKNGEWDFSGITDPASLSETTNITITNLNIPKIGGKYLLVAPAGGLTEIPPNTNLSIEYLGNRDWIINGISTQAPPGSSPAGVTLTGGWNSFTFFDNRDTSAPIRITATVYDPDISADAAEAPVAKTNWTSPAQVPAFSSSTGTLTVTPAGNSLKMEINLGNNNVISGEWVINSGDDRAISSASITIKTKDTTPKPDTPPTPSGPTDPDNPLAPNYKIPDEVVRIHFGAGADKKEDFYDIRKWDATCKGLGLHDPAVTRAADDTRLIDIKTQDNAQNALTRINDAIVQKDRIRAEYGAMQNRLENTVTNLTVQSENLQAAESRISDTDVALEMTQFVRNQILSNSAVAMLSQANSMPQMVMKLIG